MTPFLTRLRALDAAASGAPWSESTVDGYIPIVNATHEEVAAAQGMSAAEDAANARLIVALRNAADSIAALVEAAGAVMRKAGVSRKAHGMTYTVPAECFNSLCAALAALDKEGVS